MSLKISSYGAPKLQTSPRPPRPHGLSTAVQRALAAVAPGVPIARWVETPRGPMAMAATGPVSYVNGGWPEGKRSRWRFPAKCIVDVGAVMSKRKSPLRFEFPDPPGRRCGGCAAARHRRGTRRRGLRRVDIRERERLASWHSSLGSEEFVEYWQLRTNCVHASSTARHAYWRQNFCGASQNSYRE